MPILYNTLTYLALNLHDELPHLIFINIIVIQYILRINEYPAAFYHLFLFSNLTEQLLVGNGVLEGFKYGIMPDTIFGLQSISLHDWWFIIIFKYYIY